MEALLLRLKALNIGLRVEGGQLKVSMPKDCADTGIMDAIRQHKQELIDFMVKQLREGQTAAILPIGTKAAYRLSFAQQRLFFLYEMDRSSLAYNMLQCFRLEGELDMDLLDKSFQRLIACHEVLRTSFRLLDGEPVQEISAAVEVAITVYDTAEDPGQLVRAFVRPFDLGVAPLLRVGVVHVGEQSHILMIDLHHIISDGISEGILLRDFMQLYQGIALPRPLLQYKDYAEWQRRHMASDQDGGRAFWHGMYSELPSPLELPYDFRRPLHKTYAGGKFSFSTDGATTSALRSLASKEGVTLFMVLYAAYYVLLSRLCRTEDVVIGVPVAGRHRAELEELPGMFVNTLAVRTTGVAGMSFRELLSAVRQQLLLCFEHEHYPYERLIEELSVPRDSSRNPLFDVIFTYQNYERVDLSLPGLSITPYVTDYNTAQFDLGLSVSDEGEELLLHFDYASALFELATIARFGGYFQRILQEVLSDVVQPLSGINLLSESEAALLYDGFNDTAVAYDTQADLMSVFSLQALQYGDATAVVCGTDRLSYSLLDRQSNQVAHYLRTQLGVQPGSLVGLLVERDIYLFPVLFGILKAGAAYVPLDPGQPAERLSVICSSAGLEVVLTRGRYWSESAVGPASCIDLDVVWETILSGAVTALDVEPGGSSAAYVLFTSGSTGEPKGVVVEHHSVLNRLLWMQRMYVLDGRDVLIQKTPLVFDVSVWELFWWFFGGASVCIPAVGSEKDPVALEGEIVRQGVTVIHFVPSMLQSFLQAVSYRNSYERLGGVRLVFSSGEELGADQVTMFGSGLHHHNGTRLVNLYGPTEATVDVSYHECDFTSVYERVPIGHAIDNIRLYVLDKSGGLCGIGVAGELHISGAGLARGYLNKVDQTIRSFRYYPLWGNERLYATGDLVKRNNNGELVYLGRIDQQVKLRGYRIELEEISQHLSSYAGIDSAVVLLWDRGGDPQLCAWYQSADVLSADVLQRYLSGRLPGYMVPTYYKQVESFPLTKSGKLDRRGLPAPDMLEAGAVYVGPSSPLEQQLALIWSDILELPVEAISTQRSFFELGGHSIKAFHLINRIQRQVPVNISIADVFRYPSIQQLATWMEGPDATPLLQIEHAGNQDSYFAAAAQERLFYEQFLHQHITLFNNGSMLELADTVDTERLIVAFNAVVARHEALRTRFMLTPEGIKQAICERLDIVPEILRDDFASPEEAFGYFVRPFDLLSAPPLRCGLLMLGGKRYLIVDLHHIICDGISLNILVKDLVAIYEGEQLPDTGLRYVDYAAWLKSEEPYLARQKEYWLQQLYGYQFGSEIRNISTGTVADDHRHFSQVLLLDDTFRVQMKQLTAATGVSDFMLLLTANFILLAKMSGQPDVVIGTDMVGRSVAALQKVVGTFVNLLPLRVQVLPDMTFEALLLQVKVCVTAAMEHQDYPFDQLVFALREGNQQAGAQLINVHFSIENVIETMATLRQVEIVPVKPVKDISPKYGLEFTVQDVAGELRLIITARGGIYEADTVRLISGYYHDILKSMLKDSKTTIRKLVLGQIL